MSFDLILKNGGIIDGTGNPFFKADIVVFDEQKIADLATYENPHQFPQGIDYVIVNGTIVVEKGTQTEEFPGQVLGYQK